MTPSEAIREVELGRCQRIASPGKWKVWREGLFVRWRRYSHADMPLITAPRRL